MAWLLPLAVSTALWSIHLALIYLESRADELILPLVAAILLLSLTTLYRLDRPCAFWQVLWTILGLGLALMEQAFLPAVRELRSWWPWFLALSISFLFSTLLWGVEAGGAKSWLVLGPVRFQPSEPAKILYCLGIAGYLTKKKELLMVRGWRLGPVKLPHPAYLGPLVLVLALTMLLMVVQRDLGTALLFFGLLACQFYVAAPRLDYLLGGLLTLILGAVAAYRFFPHVQARIDIWLNPWASPQAGGFQVIQSLLAISSGGILGAGLGRGYPQIIPAVTTDLTFAAWTEETGIAGAVALISLYLLLLERAFKAALSSRDDFTLLVGTGLASLLALQSLVILAGTLGLVPLTGVTLPLFNYGGSSLVTSLASVGFLLKISAEAKEA
ncbi:MAG: FtsW/RodA/SpoVE family cell cycle protein [bacterium]